MIKRGIVGSLQNHHASTFFFFFAGPMGETLMTRGSVRALSSMGHPTGDLNSEYVLSELYRHQPGVRVFIADSMPSRVF